MPNTGGTDGAAHILVVEDSRAQRAYLAAILGNAGHVVTEAGDGTEGETLARGKHFDLVITDLEMPGQNGIELTRRLRELPEYKTLPIVIMSVRADLDSRVDGLTTGANDYLVKPLEQREVEARVRSLLQLGRSRRELERRNLQLAETLTELQRCQSRLVAGEKLAYAGRLAGGIAHECNSPLQTLTLAFGVLQQHVTTLIQSVPAIRRTTGETAEICAETPDLVATCCATIERLTETVGRFSQLQRAAVPRSLAHCADLRGTLARAVDRAAQGGGVSLELPTHPVRAMLAHPNLEAHLATLLAHISATHGQTDARLIATTSGACIEVSARIGGDASELLGSDFSAHQGRIQFDMSATTAREALLRIGARVDTRVDSDQRATLDITLPLEPDCCTDD